MAWSEKLKLNKRLIQSLTEAGFTTPKDIQLKTLSRINGGQDVIAVGPEGSGKTSTYILAVLNRFRYSADGVPKVLILVPDKESVIRVIDQFELLNKNKSILIVGLYAAIGTETQMNALADGSDIVVATPDRARAIYLKLGLNLNKIEMFVVDDAELIVKQGLQLPTAELANSITKAQRLVFTEVVHEKLYKMINPFMKMPALVEVDEAGQPKFDTHPQVLYHVPNFGTKLNLMNLFMQDEELFTKMVVFVNTRPTAEKLYKSLQNRLNNKVALYKSWFFELQGFSDIEEFKGSDSVRLLIAVNNDAESIKLEDIPFLIHFELPDDKEIFIGRIINQYPDKKDETMAITFSTDIELATIKKIEQVIGAKIPLAELPDELHIEKERKRTEQKPVDPESSTGDAFHQKKASNSKTYNLGAGKKAKLTNKKKHS
jgi:superfamily II DNA/RNA helicase